MGLSTPSGAGTHMAIRPTPATRAGTAFIRTEDGYAALPPGTYSPTASSAVQRIPRVSPASSSTRKSAGRCARWKSSILSAARSRARVKSAGRSLTAAAISSSEIRSRSAGRDTRSKRAVYSTTASSPRARTSAMIAATAWSTRSVVSRACSSNARKVTSKSGSAVESRFMTVPGQRETGRSRRRWFRVGSSRPCG